MRRRWTLQERLGKSQCSEIVFITFQFSGPTATTPQNLQKPADAFGVAGGSPGGHGGEVASYPGA